MRLFADRVKDLEENLRKLTKSWKKRKDGRGEATLRRVLAGSGDDN